jgi:hypothetical protein
MSNDEVKGNLERMERLDFEGWNKADWRGTFAHLHTEDVYVDFKGSAPTKGIDEHIQAMESFTAMLGGTPPQIVEHPIAFGSGEWTCVVGQASDGSRMVTVARWVDGAISEEYIWS